MAKTALAPLGALFSAMKRYGGISYKELASLILSEKPRAKGVSPANRVNDRTWISRYLVHAPVDAIKSSYFTSSEKCAMRIISRLKKRMSDQEILDVVIGRTGDDEARALLACGQDVRPYRNTLTRLSNSESGQIEERIEIAMVLIVTGAIYADVPTALSRAAHFAKAAHGPSASVSLMTPRVLRPAAAQRRSLEALPALGVVRIEGGHIADAPHWFDPTQTAEIEVGAFATQPDSLNDVADDVSRHHARIWHDGGSWFVEGLGSTNGTTLISGLDGSETVVEPPRDSREGWRSEPVMLKPADELVFGSNTRYLVIASMQAPGDALQSPPPRNTRFIRTA